MTIKVDELWRMLSAFNAEIVALKVERDCARARLTEARARADKLMTNQIDLERRRAERAEADLTWQTALTTYCRQVLERVTGTLTAADASFIADMLISRCQRAHCYSCSNLAQKMTALAEALAALEATE